MPAGELRSREGRKPGTPEEGYSRAGAEGVCTEEARARRFRLLRSCRQIIPKELSLSLYV
jgi:hypothetical protein